ncbi:hypothetical protein SAMN05443245_7342 [Paraburkholderia fungorum]|uniref:Response regulatory domain-containing protein n=2 Tax=Paraburkholderia fungorum TaxID=134537 RepID=A0A1H1JVE2_9BURK|nr:hypothetical protein SAMN05443245_7342 [Paraburkholderia fungorum]
MRADRLSHKSAVDFALWSQKIPNVPNRPRSVVVAHADTHVAETLALYFRLKEISSVTTSDMAQVALILDFWKPGAVLIDTRLCWQDNYSLIREASIAYALSGVLIIALTGASGEEQPADMQRLGFDGICTEQFSAWRTVEMLSNHLIAPTL